MIPISLDEANGGIIIWDSGERIYSRVKCHSSNDALNYLEVFINALRQSSEMHDAPEIVEICHRVLKAAGFNQRLPYETTIVRKN